MSNINTAFDPLTLRGLQLKNRFIKAATYEGMCVDGRPTAQLDTFHARIAEGGVAMTTIAYAAVNPDGRTHEDQLLMNDSASKEFESLTAAIHSNGGAANIQLTHCGFFTRNKRLTTKIPLSASRSFNNYGLMSGLPFSRAMSIDEINQVVVDFADSARQAKAVGFDCVEIHMGHGYLLSQFLSPSINKRTDKYGGTLTNRLRFPLQVIQAVRDSCGSDFPITVKLNLSDGFKGGFSVAECAEACGILGKNSVDAITLSGGYTSKTPFYLMRGEVPWKGMMEVEPNPLQKMAIGIFGPLIMKKHAFTENYFMDMARQVRDAVDMPLAYLGGVVSAKGVEEAVTAGFDLIGLGRSLIHNPDFIQTIQRDQSHISPCNHCNQCMVEMDKGGVRCVL